MTLLEILYSNIDEAKLNHIQFYKLFPKLFLFDKSHTFILLLRGRADNREPS